MSSGPRAVLPVLAIDPFVRLARDPAAINKGRRDAVGQSRCRAECIGFCQTGECCRDDDDEDQEKERQKGGIGTRTETTKTTTTATTTGH